MIEDVYIHTFDLKSVTVTQDAGGANEQTKAVKYANEPCLVKSISGREIVEHLKRNLKASYKLLCDPALDIEQTDIVEWKDKEYEIAFIKHHEMGDNQHKELWLENAD